MKASVPKLFFCPGSASYTPVTQGSRWRVASRQLRKPTTPSALAFFVVDRASSGFPFSCAVQNPITPFTPPLPTRPLFPKNTDPQRLSTAALTLTNAPRFPNGKAFQTRNKAIHSRNKAMQRPEIRSQTARKPTSKAWGTDAGSGKAHFRGGRRALPPHKCLKGGGKGALFRLASTQKAR